MRASTASCRRGKREQPDPARRAGEKFVSREVNCLVERMHGAAVDQFGLFISCRADRKNTLEIQNRVGSEKRMKMQARNHPGLDAPRVSHCPSGPGSSEGSITKPIAQRIKQNRSDTIRQTRSRVSVVRHQMQTNTTRIPIPKTMDIASYSGIHLKRFQ